MYLNPISLIFFAIFFFFLPATDKVQRPPGDHRFPPEDELQHSAVWDPQSVALPVQVAEHGPVHQPGEGGALPDPAGAGAPVWPVPVPAPQNTHLWPATENTLPRGAVRNTAGLGKWLCVYITECVFI